ncbi:AAA family ATPase [Vibrio parahaemolyticus]|nr:AAA family ATPase [Vibrio parahaemolyticus]HCG7159584.1 ATP-binding protein [Vibrio parahaemolyticus]
MISELKLKNVGPIQEATVPMKDLTIICGRNGVGKTYLSYSYYMFIHNFRRLLFKSVQIPEQATDSIIDMASATEPSRKSFDIKLDDLGISYDSISEVLKEAGKSDEIFSTLEINKSENTSISGGIEIETYESLISAKANVGLNGSLEINLSKEEHEDTVKLTLSKEHEEELDIDDIFADMRFIIGVFVVDYLMKLSQFPITSERTGISLFFEDLAKIRRDFKHSAVEHYTYPRPIENNIGNMGMIKSRKYAYNHFVNDEKSSFQSQVSDILGGSYKFENDSLYFQPKDKDVLVPLRVSSGASKSLLLLDYFMYNYNAYGALIIDEPELNLHLDSQKEIARVLCSIANRGIKVVVTTHSDHFIREINNLIMLSSSNLRPEHRQAIMEKAGVKIDSVIKPNQVSTVVLSAKERKSFTMPVSEYGIDLKLFNDEIMGNNDISSELAMAIYEGQNV